jgi:hypothetical protein
LDKAELIETPFRGKYRITQRGKEALQGGRVSKTSKSALKPA